MISQIDIADIIGKLADSPVRGSAYKRQIAELLHYYSAQGTSLETVRDWQHLSLSEYSARAYAREFGCVFPDYCPRALRPKKAAA